MGFIFQWCEIMAGVRKLEREREREREYNGPFRKLSRAMLVTSFGGQCRKKTA